MCFKTTQDFHLHASISPKNPNTHRFYIIISCFPLFLHILPSTTLMTLKMLEMSISCSIFFFIRLRDPHTQSLKSAKFYNLVESGQIALFILKCCYIVYMMDAHYPVQVLI